MADLAALQAELDQINRQLGAAPPLASGDRPGFLTRAGGTFVNEVLDAPWQVSDIGKNIIQSIPGLGLSPESEAARLERRKRLQQQAAIVDLPEAQGFGEKTADVLGTIGKELALLYAPNSKLTAAGKALGLGRAAPAAADVATGALSGLRTSGQEGGIQAGEFGVGGLMNQMVPGSGLQARIARAALQAATPLAGSAIRQQDPFTEQNAVQAGVQAVFGGLYTPDKIPLGPPRPTADQARSMPVSQRAVQPTLEMQNAADAAMLAGMAERNRGERTLLSPIERPELKLAPMDQGPLIRPKEEKPGFLEPAAPKEAPRIINTAIRMPDGTILQGEGFEGHPSIFTKAPPDADIKAVFSGAGFWGVDAEGNTRFLTREEALPIAVGAGQIPPVSKKATKLTSEMLRGDTFDDLIQNRPAAPKAKQEVAMEDQIAAQRDALLKQAASRGLNPEAAEDFAQDTILRAIQNKEKFDPAKGTVGQWVANLGKNLDIDQRRAAEAERAGGTMLRADEAELQNVPAPEQAPAMDAKMALAALDTDTRKVVEDHFLGGKSQTDIANELGVTPQAVQKKIEGAKRMMRMKLKGKYGGASIETLSQLGGTAAGGLYGFATGDTPEERLTRALLFGGAGFLGGTLLPKAAQGARTLFEPGPAPEPQLTKQTQPQATETPKTPPSKPVGERISEWWNEKATKQFTGEEKSASGAIVRWAETMGIKPVAEGLSKIFRNNRNISANWNESIKDVVNQISRVIDRVTDQDRDIVRQWMRNPRTPESDSVLQQVNPEYAGAAIKLRDLVKELQGYWMKGESDPRKRALGEASFDNWQTRAFDIFEDPNFSPKQEDVAAWREYLKKNHPETYKDLPDELIDRNIREDVEAKRRNKAFTSIGANDRIAQALFRHRKDLTPQQWSKIEQLASDPSLPPETQKVFADAVPNRDFTPELQAELQKVAALKGDPELGQMAIKEVLPPEYRKVLGEINEPVRTLGLSAVKMVRSAAAGKLFSDISDMPGLRVTEAEYAQMVKDSPNREALMNEYVKAPDTASLGILGTDRVATQNADGKTIYVDKPTYIRREVMDQIDAFNQQFDRNANVVWGALSKTASWQKRALTSWNPAGQVRNWMTTPVLSAIGGVYGKGSLDSFKEGVKIALGKSPLADEARKFGVTGVDFASSELKGKIQEATTNPPPPLKQELAKALKGDWKAGWNVLKRADRFASNAYAMPDNSVRAATWVQHTKRLQDLGMDAAQAKEAAADLVRRWTWDYSNQPRWVRVARNVPFLNPFLTFQVEGIRVLKNLVQDAALFRKGWDKLTPLEKYRAKHGIVAAPAMLAYPAMMAALFESTLSDDEKKKWDRTKQLMPSYLRYNYVAPMGMKDDNTFNYVGLQPYTISSVTPMIKAIMEGRPGDIVTQSGLVGLRAQPGIAALIDISQGRREIGGAPVKTPGEIAARVTDTLLPAPAQSYNRQRFAEALTPTETGSLGISNPRTGRSVTPSMFALNQMGVNVSQANPQAMLRARRMEKEEAKRDARSRYATILKSNAAPEVKRDAQEALLADLREIEAEFRSMFGR